MRKSLQYPYFILSQGEITDLKEVYDYLVCQEILKNFDHPDLAALRRLYEYWSIRHRSFIAENNRITSSYQRYLCFNEVCAICGIPLQEIANAIDPKTAAYEHLADII